MRRAGLVVVLLGLLLELVPRAYYAALSLDLVDPPVESFETVTETLSVLTFAAVLVLVLGVLLLLAARTPSSRASYSPPYPPSAPGSASSPYGSPRGSQPPPPTYLS